MRYTVTNNFIKISESAGTIQNTSQIYTLEVSESTTKNSGILVYALNSVTFSGSPVYVRCVDTNGFIDVRVATFTVGGASSLPVELKVTGATAGNFAIFDANGAIVDSGFTVAPNAGINAMLTNVFGASTAG